MKRVITTAMLVLVFSAMVSAAAEPKNCWIMVEGGSWVPPDETIEKIKEKIEPFVSVQAKMQGRTLQKWESYTFQFQGQEDHTKQLVYINAFCVSDSSIQLSKQMVMALDGGTCFFNVKFDPSKIQFFELVINGEA